MSKLSYLLSFLIILNACSSVPIEPALTDPVSNVAAEEVVVDKISNSIKIKAPDAGQRIDKIGVKKTKPFFDWPVWEARMTRGYLPNGTRKRKRAHRGIDLAAPRGSAVMSSHDGVVIYTGAGFKGYGKMVMVETTDSREGGNWATLYGHMDKILVYEGKKIKQGEVIGALGNTGRSSGPHLHFEIRRLNGPIDPLPMLPAGESLTNDVDNGSADE